MLLEPGGSDSAGWAPLTVFRHVVACGASILCSAFAPALVVVVFFRGDFASLVFLVALAHGLVLGVPLYLLARWLGWVNIATAVLGGFLVGAVPIGLYLGLDVDRTLTMADWLAFGAVLIMYGAFGALGGFAFWLALGATGGLGDRPRK